MVSPVIFISGFKVGVVEHGRLHVANLEAALQLRYANTLLAKCEQIFMGNKLQVWWTSRKPKFLAQSRPGLHYLQQQLDQHRVKNLETSAKFCIEYIIATLKAAIYDTGFFFYFILPSSEHSATWTWTVCVQRNLKVYI